MLIGAIFSPFIFAHLRLFILKILSQNHIESKAGRVLVYELRFIAIATKPQDIEAYNTIVDGFFLQEK